MDILTRTIFAALAAGLAVSLTACSGTPILSALSTGRQVPPDGVVLRPNERITLNVATVKPAKRTEYFCSNGLPLQCERLNLNLYCTCPGVGR